VSPVQAVGLAETVGDCREAGPGGSGPGQGDPTVTPGISWPQSGSAPGTSWKLLPTSLVTQVHWLVTGCILVLPKGKLAFMYPFFRPASAERWISKPARIEPCVITKYPRPRPVVHLELHTGDEVQAGAFYQELLNWTPQPVRTASGSYLTMDLGGVIGGGVVECRAPRPLWLPYVEVDRVVSATEHARRLGASVILEPCEGPSGWRSVVSSPVAGEVALWELRR